MDKLQGPWKAECETAILDLINAALKAEPEQPHALHHLMAAAAELARELHISPPDYLQHTIDTLLAINVEGPLADALNQSDIPDIDVPPNSTIN